ncbi:MULTISPECIES: DUF3575 domain-containing protein [Bacteroidaceae]|uniref:DUF3575 domain-containing protein n=1 Tax=Phocaeicola intestinalis TaxID=2762212 RepID=A0ABR8Y4W6_9BACT|nr:MULTISPECIES: DUF3575 domain-containing protein [Bacteroidaceae]MBD8039173.1 DUF3575 domain-containing protein [Phocaeicola intestinalis]OUP36959.1 hypothetical protein B5F25_02110 [Bacteroides sp. An19]
MKRLLFVLLSCIGLSVSAQNWAVKTNLLYDMTATMNLGAEVRMSPQWTLDVSANWNPWTFSDNKKWKQLSFQPEARYWFCEAFNGHFLGAHLLGGIYNMSNWDTDFTFLGTDFGKLKDHRYEGWMLGAGIAYGYQWILSKHWSIEAEIGIGYVYSRYDKYRCAGCGRKTEEGKSHHFVGPTKAAVNLIYVF